MPSLRCCSILLSFLVFASTIPRDPVSAQTAPAPIKIQIVYDTSDASSSAVTPLLIKQVAAQPKSFTLAKDDEKNMVVIADCYRETPSDRVITKQAKCMG
jgi:hypothetical protein